MKLKYLKYILVGLLVAYFASCSSSDSDSTEPTPVPETTDFLPAKEFRAAWLTTVGNDFPMGDYTVEGQKALYIKYMETLAENNFNAVFMQVRGMADAFYKSKYEPWSKYLTGERGKDPGYASDFDMMQFMIDEAHKRNIEFHAWINPYRISTNPEVDYDNLTKLEPKIDPDLVKKYEEILVYNPALPEVRDLIGNIIEEMLILYNVDGIHIDDYFYPNPKDYKSLDDEKEYKKYGEEYATIQEFRYENVNKMVKAIHDKVKAVKPEVVFSVSPGGNHSYNNSIYANTPLWCQQGWMDVIVPQIYFASGPGSKDGSFNNRLHWFCQFAYDVPVLVGHALYKFGDPDAPGFGVASELQTQFDFAATMKRVKGSVMYKSSNLHTNPVNIMEVIEKQYADPAIRPIFGRTTLPAPEAPTSVKVTGSDITWAAKDGLYYAVYQDQGKEEVARLIALTKADSYALTEKGSYFVSAVNKENMESEVSDTVVY